ALQTIVGQQLFPGIKDKLAAGELNPTDRVNYSTELRQFLSLFNEASPLTSSNYVNDPTIHNTLFFYKEGQPLQTAEKLSPNFNTTYPGQSTIGQENE